MPRHGLAVATAETPQQPASAPRASGMASWPIRRKLVALVLLPLLLILSAGAYLTTQSFFSLREAQRAGLFLRAITASNDVVSASDVELTASLKFRREGGDEATEASQLASSRVETDGRFSALSTVLGDPPPGGWSPQLLALAEQMNALAQSLPGLREQVDRRALPDLQIANSYREQVLPARQLTNQLAIDLSKQTSDPALVDGTAVLTALATAGAQASDEAVRLTLALQRNEPVLGRNKQELDVLKASQINLIDIAFSRATAAQRSGIETLRALDPRIDLFRADALNPLARALAANPQDRDEETTRAAGRATFFASTAADRIAEINDLITSTADDLKVQSSQDVRSALIRTILVAALALISVVMVLVFVTAIARTVTGPMRRLRSGAVDAATVRLPAAVRQIEREGPTASVVVPPVLPYDAKVGPETREVAQALDGLTGEAIRLATSQVRLRQALDEAFVSMSRRSQLMVEKQLAIIDELESTEEDPEQLRNLFRLDHLAARMRRYNDNLLVLAGSAVRTRSNAPVPIADVFRAATSEMEQYERVRLQPLSGASVSGPAAGGLIHLLAELLDNAAMYSPPTSPIVLAAAFSPDGGLRLEVIDSGVGIPPAEMAELNERLATPAGIDTQVPSRMGLFVVARLAKRGGLAVRLGARAQTSGTLAEVLVPANLVLGAPAGLIQKAPSAVMPGPSEPPQLPAQNALAAGAGGRAPAAAPPRRGSTPRIPAAQGSADRAAPIAGDGGSGWTIAGGITDTDPPRRPAIGAPAVGAPTVGAPTVGAPAQPVAGSPAGAGPRAGAGLPSRRPGAALAGNPLAATAAAAAAAAAAPPVFGAPAPAASNRPAPAQIKPVGPGVPPRGGASRPGSRSPFESNVPWGQEHVQSQDRPPTAGPAPLPTRQPAQSAGAAAPPTRGIPAGAGAAGRPGADDSLPRRAPGSSSPSPLPFSDPNSTAASPAGNPFQPPAGRPPIPGISAPSRAGGASGPTAGGERPGVPAGRAGAGDSRSVSGPPGSRPGSRPLPVRSPGPRDSGTHGPSAATAAAAAASARNRPLAAAPTSGLFAETGPATAPLATGQIGPRTPGTAVKAISGNGQPTGQQVGQGSASPFSRPSSPAGPAAFAPPLGMEIAPRQPVVTSSLPVAGSAPEGRDEVSIGSAPHAQDPVPTPIFDSISVWFSDDATRTTTGSADTARVIDLREGANGVSSAGEEPTAEAAPALDAARGGASSGNRWSSLGDQRWIATNARAASTPETAGSTTAGLPRRRPGANLLPSAATAAAVASPSNGRRTDAESVRGRLGSYQRGLSSARRARHLPADTESVGLFKAPPGESEAGRRAGEVGGHA